MQPSNLMIGRQSRRCADGSSCITSSVSSTATTITPATMCSPSSSRPPHPDTTRQRFDRLAAAAAAHHFHDLRHPYATDALTAGVRPKVISERIGHADVGFFLQTYAHVLKDDDRDVAEQASSIPPATTGHRAPWPF